MMNMLIVRNSICNIYYTPWYISFTI